ncbi:MAG: PadR family transcriptional regulator [Clostridia bacterium]|nr:PadR family transcriptional regulator [Clostridia bacterium]
MFTTNAYALLGLLSLKPMTGYEMKKWVEQALTHFWKTSYGQIYPTMARLEKYKLVESRNIESASGPNRIEYALTELGQDALIEWLREDTEDFNDKDETLLKFYFSDLLSEDEMIAKLQRSIDFNESILQGYSGDVDHMEEVKLPTRKQLNQYLCTKKGVYLNEARIKWAKECIEALKWFKDLKTP